MATERMTLQMAILADLDADSAPFKLIKKYTSLSTVDLDGVYSLPGTVAALGADNVIMTTLPITPQFLYFENLGQEGAAGNVDLDLYTYAGAGGEVFSRVPKGCPAFIPIISTMGTLEINNINVVDVQYQLHILGTIL